MVLGKGKKYQRKPLKKETNELIGLFFLLPIVLVITVVPLIVFARLFEVDGFEASYWRGGTIFFDFFSYYKSIYFALFVYTGFIFVLFLWWIERLNLVKDKKYLVPMGIYAIFVLFSTFNAPNRTIALRGFMETFQGVFVLIGYMLMVFIVFNLVKTRKHLYLIIGSFIFLGVMIGLLGASQYFGRDFFQTEFGSMLILPKELEPLLEEVRFRIAHSRIYATMYSTNYVGSYAALMIPFSVGLLFAVKRWYLIPLTVVFLGINIFVLFGSNSRAGMVGVALSSVFFVIFYRWVFIKKPIRFLLLLLGGLFVTYQFNAITEGGLVDRVKTLNVLEAIEAQEGRSHIEDIVVDGYTLEIQSNYESIRIEYVGNDLFFYDLDGNALDVNSGTHFTFNDEGYDSFRVTRNEIGKFTVRMYSRTMVFYIHETAFMMETWRGNRVTPEHVPRLALFDGYERLFSGRAYIWSRSIPLMFNNFFIGQGPDSYIISFPQEDVIGRLNGIRSGLIDKPHNMFIQIGVNTGFISLLGWLGLAFIYVFSSFKLYFKSTFKHFEEILGVALFVSVIAYLISGMFNDQVISVAPLYYVMLGLGIAVNNMVKRLRT